MPSTCLISPSTLRLCAICSIFSFAASASAQSIMSRPTVTRAEDLIQAYDSRVPLGTNAIFRPRPTAKAKSIIDSGVQVRIFELPDNESKPHPVDKIGDCYIYISTVRKLEASPDGGLKFAHLDQGWVNVTYSGNSAKDGRWFLVFEQKGPSEKQFRILAKDAEEYFGTGFAVTVFPTDPVPLTLIKAAYEQREGDGARLLREVDQKDPHVPCYSYSRVQVAGPVEETLVANIGSCARPEDPIVRSQS